MFCNIFDYGLHHNIDYRHSTHEIRLQEIITIYCPGYHQHFEDLSKKTLSYPALIIQELPEQQNVPPSCSVDRDVRMYA